MIAAALLLYGQVLPAQTKVGPFVIETKSYREESYPNAGALRSVTALRWRSPNGLAAYNLTDDGEYVVASYRVDAESGWCQSNPDPIRLTASPSIRFEVECKLLSAEKAQLLSAEIRAAQPYFKAAYASFYEATLRQHGPDLQRCRKTASGNHGIICVDVWDQRRAATDQSKNKRIP